MNQLPAVIVVVESGFGNTRRIAESIVEGIGPDAELIDVENAPSAIPQQARLVVVGGPTHAFGLSSAKTRTSVVEQGGSALKRGIREWIADLEKVEGVRAATFDTKAAKVRRFPGSAAARAAKFLRRKGFVLIAQPSSFYVSDIKGPLLDGELERARSFGSELAMLAGTTASKE